MYMDKIKDKVKNYFLQFKHYGFTFGVIYLLTILFNQCHLDKVFYDENSISYAVMH